ncbi:MAG: membrane protein insertase YidC, partial [Bacteroidales bacterium]|nr:membrane protein insertase YidC [Bacteroidales bacterium]
MNKNSIIGFILIMGLFFAWAWWTMPSKEEQERQAEAKRQIEAANFERKRQAEAQFVEQQRALQEAEVAQNAAANKQQTLIKNFGLFSNSSEQEEMLYQLENDVFTVAISNKGGIVHHVWLKDYKKYDSTAVTLFDPTTVKLALGFFDKEGRTITTEKLYYQPVWYDTPENEDIALNHQADSARFGMRLYANDTADFYNPDKYIEFLYTIRKGEYMLGFEILFHNLQNDIVPRAGTINLDWRQDLRRNEQDIKSEREKATVYYKVSRSDVDNLSESKEKDDKNLREKLDWISFKSRFFVSTLISQKYPFWEANIKTEVVERYLNNEHYLQSMEASIALPWEARNDYNIPMNFYFGPNKYHTLKSYDMDLEKLVPLGGWFISWINKGVIWVFDLMSSWNWNY